MEKNRVILRNYWGNSGANQYTMNLPLNAELHYGLDNVVIEFSNSATKTLNVILNFLFEAPADTFYQNNTIKLAGDLHLTNIPVNVGTVINMDYVFDAEDEFVAFFDNFIHDQVLEII